MPCFIGIGSAHPPLSNNSLCKFIEAGSFEEHNNNETMMLVGATDFKLGGNTLKD
tara:strand:+ start:592 stop:756 length:165 start_codon:yes stop_codon:yes gene_type:complete